MIPCYILAGGRSSRFGSDKARALLDGEPLVVRVARMLEVDAIVVAAESGTYDDLGLTTIGDDEPGLGPVGGVMTALRHAAGPVFVAGCDLRDPRAEWAQQVIGTGTTAAVRTARGWEPLFARYEPEVLPVAETLLAEDERSLQVLLDQVGAVALEPPEGWPGESSFNRPEELGS